MEFSEYCENGVDVGMGLGSVELGWDPESDVEPRLGRSGNEFPELFFFEEEVQWSLVCEDVLEREGEVSMWRVWTVPR